MDIIIAIILCIILITFLHLKKRIPFSAPGPTPLPIIGNLHLIDKGKPQYALHNLYLKYGNIYSLWMGSVYAVVLSETDIIQDALVNHSDVFSDRYITPLSAIVGQLKDLGFSNGDTWSMCRAIWASAFTRSKVLQMEKTLTNNIIKCLDVIEKESESGEPVNIRYYVKKIAFNAVFQLLLSNEAPYELGKSNDLDDLIHATDEVAKWMSHGNPGDFIPLLKPFSNVKIICILNFKKLNLLISTPIQFTNLQNAIDCVNRHLNKYIQEHKDTIDPNNPRNFMDNFILEVENHKEGILDDVCILKNSSDFIIAGTDTTASTIDWSIVFLANYPEYQEMIHKEITIFENGNNEFNFTNMRTSLHITQNFIKEVWRLRPIVPLSLPHRTSKEIVFHDYFIPKDTLIFTNFFSASLNEKIWKDPYVFNPMRYSNKVEASQPTLVFGFGPRKCVGNNLAEVNILLAIAHIVKRFKIERVSDEMIDENVQIGLTMDTLPYKVIVTKR
ncbi:cytochrome P450 family protein [Heterostelium album PN500]|uniref:Cytochrome P450 family protein n=1 Tax=Heterostelium pallidum (strain ATCC 26659 / Pp 5 / PN500) TaxID=670386 RepID=D3BGN7_HETP5|nr:cytochrome P450 family protein [Heterostelium album PN500]EFA79271.1 cytochrome P450 family protein [Heterostelium album PN500]|eukprot:XP_020431392.1 cytochrome P450 family protein [Heterostelium album PN500]